MSRDIVHWMYYTYPTIYHIVRRVFGILYVSISVCHTISTLRCEEDHKTANLPYIFCNVILQVLTLMYAIARRIDEVLPR